MSELERARERWLGLAEGASQRPAPAWLRGLRSDARDAFAERGFPSTREEEWRYTQIAPLAGTPFDPAAGDGALPTRGDLEALSFPVYACSLYVFVDGFPVPALSAPRALSGSVRAESLAALTAADDARLRGRLGAQLDLKAHPFAALQTALFADGAFLEIPDGVRLEQPVHLVFVTTGSGAASFPRVVIAAGAGSRARVIQDHVTLGEDHFTNAVAEVTVGANAELELVVLQRESDAVFHVGNLAARLERDARLAVRTLTLGGALVRNDLAAVLAGPGAECTLDGLFVGTGERLVDNHTLVDHAVPHGTSHELYKGVLADRSRGVFRGSVRVRPDAQRTDATQSNPNLLLSDHAEIATKPQLEIHADDVRCSHGATIGRLDEDALFYLRARGIDEEAARDLLTRGFAKEVLAKLRDDALEECVGELLLERLHGGSRP